MLHTQLSAPIWRRLAALVYDLFILLAISFAYGAAATAIAVGVTGGQHENYQPMFDSVLFLMGWIACLCGFYCWFWHKSGQTIGMKTWKIQLVSNATAPLQSGGVTWYQCILRCVIAPPSILLCGLGFWFALLDPQRRTLHDRLSQTAVVSTLPAKAISV